MKLSNSMEFKGIALTDYSLFIASKIFAYILYIYMLFPSQCPLDEAIMYEKSNTDIP